MKHTKGPWKLSEILIGDYDPDSENPRQTSHCVVAEYDDNLLITYALPPTTLSDEFYDNAKLIAAAPELLEAALSVLYDLACYCNTHEPGPGPNRRLAALQEAIAKATT